MKDLEKPGCTEQVRADLINSYKGPDIKMVVVGGAGCNFAERVCLHHLLEKERLQEMEIIAVNTDDKRLSKMVGANKKLLLGVRVTKGKGAAYREVGEYVADESKEAIREVLSDADLVIILGNAGGGTGSGVMPIIAEVAKELGALVICIVSKPFSFESESRKENADECISRLRDIAHTVLELSNDSMLDKFSDMSLEEVFLVLDRVALKVVKNMVDNINKTYTTSFLMELENILRSDSVLDNSENQEKSNDEVPAEYEIPLLIDEGENSTCASANIEIKEDEDQKWKSAIVANGEPVLNFETKVEDEIKEGTDTEQKSITINGMKIEQNQPKPQNNNIMMEKPKLPEFPGDNPG